MKRKAVLALLSAVLLLGGCVFPGYTARGAAEYDKAEICRRYRGDLGSCLAVFPDEISPETESVSYEAILGEGLFDTDGRIVLRCIYDKAAYDLEVRRLAGLTATIEYEGECWTNRIRYDEESYLLPAYITVDGYDSTYEYALLDEESHAIVYLYLSSPAPSDLAIRPYLKRDLTLYLRTDTLAAYTMYYHTFDGGASYLPWRDVSTVPVQ